MQMEPYKNRSGNSGVNAYKIGPQSIAVRFQDGETYLYTYGKPGRMAVEEMKKRALAGSGLSTYISRQVKKRYERKI